MELTSGENLAEFFNDWIYNQGYPSYSINWYQPQANQLKITVNQTQSHASVNYFEAPIPVRVSGSGGEIVELVLDNTFGGQEFLETINFQVIQVDIDPDAHLISRNNSSTLGLEDVVSESEFSIYPNPVSTTLFIEKPANILIENIAVFNVLGQVENLISNEEKIEVSQLIPGFYFMRIQTSQGTINKSFLKR
jgi:hypothetical protein